MWHRLHKALHGWRIVTGPLAALCQYLQDLGIDAENPEVWKQGDNALHIDITNVALVNRIQAFLSDVIEKQRSIALASASSAQGAEQGVDLTVPRHLLSSGRTGQNRHAYHAVLQGAILHNGARMFANFLMSRELLMHECSALPGGTKFPGHIPAQKKHIPDSCFWLRGMLPRRYLKVTDQQGQGIIRQGIFEDESLPNVEGLCVATDASGGKYSQDPRLRRVGRMSVRCRAA